MGVLDRPCSGLVLAYRAVSRGVASAYSSFPAVKLLGGNLWRCLLCNAVARAFGFLGNRGSGFFRTGLDAVFRLPEAGQVML